MNIILFGAPGAGKGTQADNIVKEFNLYKVSTGDLLREEIKKSTNIGKKIKPGIDRGQLISDDIINEIIINILSNKKYFNRLIFDGYPRNLNQAKNLDFQIKKYNQKISCILNLNIDKESIIKRILGRIICTKCNLTFNTFFNPPEKEKHLCDAKYLKKRSDDNREIVENRFETYKQDTLPILKHYAEQKILHEIDATRKINEIYDQISSIIASLET